MVPLLLREGAEVKSGEKLKVKPDAGVVLHLTQACVGLNQRCHGVVYVNIGEERRVLGSLLPPRVPQFSCDLVFDQEFLLSHNLEMGSVFFAGYSCFSKNKLEETKQTTSKTKSSDENPICEEKREPLRLARPATSKTRSSVKNPIIEENRVPIDKADFVVRPLVVRSPENISKELEFYRTIFEAEPIAGPKIGSERSHEFKIGNNSLYVVAASTIEELEPLGPALCVETGDVASFIKKAKNAGWKCAVLESYLPNITPDDKLSGTRMRTKFGQICYICQTPQTRNNVEEEQQTKIKSIRPTMLFYEEEFAEAIANYEAVFGRSQGSFFQLFRRRSTSFSDCLYAAAKDRGTGSSTYLCIEPEDIVIFMESFFNLKSSLDFFYLNCEVVLHDWGKTVVRLISPRRHYTLYVYSSKPSLTVLSCNVKHGAIQPLIQFLGSVSQVKWVKIHVDEIPRCLSFPYPDLLIIGDEKILTLERMEKKLSSRNSDTKILQVHGQPVSEDMKRLLKRHEAKYVGLPLTIENVEQVYSSLSAPKSDKWDYLPHLEWA
ncbi:hypothetical protein ABKV19_006569 [Rosa sericea]